MKYFLLLFLLIFISCGQKNSKKTMPKVVKGVLDLSEWDFQKDGPVDLKGDWEFYWDKFLKPEFVQKYGLPGSDGIVKFPGSWSGLRSKKKITVDGYATYALKIKGLKTGEELGLASAKCFSSYKLFKIQGDLIRTLFQIGVPGKTKKTAVAQFKSLKNSFFTNEESLILLVHVSNYRYREGKFNSSFKLGLKKDIFWSFDFQRYRDLLVIGILLVMCLHYMELYLSRRQDRASLFFGLFCGIMCLRRIANGYFIFWFFKDPSNLVFQLYGKLDYFTFIFMTPLFVSYLNESFSGHFKKISKFIYYPSFLFAPCILFFPAKVYSQIYFVITFQLIIFLGSLYCYLKVINLALKGKEFSKIFFVAGSIILYGVFHDILINFQIFSPPEITSFILILFVLIQSYILSTKFFKSFVKEKELTLSLEKTNVELGIMCNKVEQQNRELEGIVVERTREAVNAKDIAEESEKNISNLLNNMRQSVFSLGEDGLIINPVSDYSYEIFDEDIGGKSIFDTLLKDLDPKSELYAQFLFVINVTLGSDLFQFNIVKDGLPHNLFIQDKNKKEKNLKISYSPILGSDKTVQKIMLVIEDITELKKLEKEAKKNEENSSIKVKRLQEIVSQEKKEIQHFSREVNSNLNLAEKSINNFDVNELFRAIHTIKGVSRIYNLTGLSSEIHIYESEIAELRESDFNEESWKENFKEINEKVKKSVGNYLQLAREIYGDDVDGTFLSENLDSIEVSRSTLFNGLDKIKKLAQETNKKDILDVIKTIELQKFNDFLLGLKNIVSKISTSLNKKIELEIGGDDIYFDMEKSSMLKDSIMHIIQNSCDHGIRSEGLIKIQLAEEEKDVSIVISDNGEGIDTNFVVERALEKGIVTMEELEKLSPKEVLALIMRPGFSTKDIATEYSGRGVGLDVVKTNIQKLGGTLKLSSTIAKGTTFQIKVEKS